MHDVLDAPVKTHGCLYAIGAFIATQSTNTARREGAVGGVSFRRKTDTADRSLSSTQRSGS